MAAALAASCAAPALSATLLPPGKNCFYGSDGSPLASGTVSFYIPQTLSPKDTWQDADQTTLNTNPVSLDASGCAVIYGVGTYRQILKNSAGTTIWDQPTSTGQSISDSWGGTSTGAANAQAVALDTFDLTDGQVVNFLAGFSNTTAMTLNVNSTGAVAVVRDSGQGPVALVGGEIVVGNVVSVLYVSATSQFHILTPTPIESFDGAIFFNGTISPTPLAADQNDWTPTGGYSTANTVRVTATTPIAISGLTGGAAGRIIIFKNIGVEPITFTASSSASTAANRFLFPSSVTLRANDALTVQYDGVSTGWRLITPLISQPVASGFKNLTLVNGASPNTQIIGTADAFTLEDTYGNVIRRNSLSCTADVTVAGAGGLDTGSLTTNTWYSYWFIYNPATNTDSCLFSTSATSPTMPSGYTFRSRAGWNRTDATGSGTFYRVRQSGRVAQYTTVSATNTATLRAMASGIAGDITVPTWVAVAVANFVPSTASIVRVSLAPGGGTMMVAPNNVYGVFNSTTNGPPLVASGGAQVSNITGDVVLESTNLYWASNSANCLLRAFGWIDNL